MWRKNRVPNVGSPCIGVDVNRNFPIGFGDPAGADPNACGESMYKNLNGISLFYRNPNYFFNSLPWAKSTFRVRINPFTSIA